MDTLQQLGELLLTSIPTVAFLLFVWFSYRKLVHKKLEHVLSERQARTDGAIQRAQAEIAQAEARTAEYEQRLREAQSEVYRTQEARRRHIMEKRDTALTEARRHADAMVKQSREQLERDVHEARSTLEQQADALAAKIIDSVLRPVAATGSR